MSVGLDRSLPLVVVHDWGAAEGASAWRDLVSGWPGGGLARHLPGHAGEPPPVGGSYAPGDGALYAVRWMREAGVVPPSAIAVGHGWGAFSAELLAAAGRVRGAVLVDGLGGPWLSPEEMVDDDSRWLHAVLADDDAVRPPSGPLDPRLGHGFPSIWDRDFTRARRASITVPVVALESPRSPTPAGERDERAASFAGGCVWRPIGSATAGTVLAELLRVSP